MAHIRQFWLAAILACNTVASVASVPLEATLAEMSQRADHILLGRVLDVDMVDKAGKPVHDGRAMTGPCLGNTIRLRVKVDEVLATTSKAVPPHITVPLDSFMHYTLAQIKRAHAGEQEPFLLLLKGPDYAPILAGVFSRPISDKAEALRIYQSSMRTPYVKEPARAALNCK